MLFDLLWTITCLEKAFAEVKGWSLKTGSTVLTTVYIAEVFTDSTSTG